MQKGNHKKKKSKDLTPQGVAKAATVELTKIIKQIGNEFHKDTVDNGGNRLTKIQTLGRLVWDKALGYTEVDVDSDVVIHHNPDKAFIGMIWDRLEGKVVPAVSGSGKDKATLSERVKEQSKRRLNQAAKNADSS